MNSFAAHLITIIKAIDTIMAIGRERRISPKFFTSDDIPLADAPKAAAT